MQLSDITRAPETRTGMVLALAICFALKSLVLVLLANQPINNDGVLYIAAAQEMARGNIHQSLAIYHMPLVPLLIAAMHLVVPDWLAAGRMVSFFAVVLALVPLYLTTRDLFGPKAAFFCGLAFALAPFTTEFVTYVYRGGAYFCFLAWAVYFAQLAVRDPQPRLFALGALFSGAAGLCRVEGIVFVGIATLFFCICLPFTPRTGRGALIKGIAAWSAVFILALVGFLAVLGPESFTAAGFAAALTRIQNVFQFNLFENYQQLYHHLKLMGELSPYPSGNQNFAEIARHWILVIYLIGLMEVLIGVVFFPFFIAFLVGLRHAWSRSSALLMWTFGCYLLFVYVTHVSRDFIQTRFLFAPAFLLYPWVGLGLERIWRRLKCSRRPVALGAVFVICFVALPLADSAYMVSNRDPLLATGGRWVDSVPELAAARKFFNDGRVAYHGGQGWVEYKRNHDLWRDSGAYMEDFARTNGIEVVVRSYSRHKKPDVWGDFQYFKKWKTFEGGKDIVEVYAAPGLDPSRLPAAKTKEAPLQ